MKKFTQSVVLRFPILLVLFVLGIALQTNAQINPRNVERCGTYQVMENYFLANPSAKANYEAQQKMLQEKYEANLRKKQSSANDVQNRTNVIYNVPVVVHVVLNGTLNPQVTDAQILSQIAILNADYGGLNADSTNIPAAFKPVYGKSNLRFCLAARTPTNQPTNGIVRVVSSTVSAPGTNDPVKITASGGSDPWDINKYMNIWVCQIGSGALSTLGYSNLPGAGVPRPGFVNDYRCFGTGGTAQAPFNLGRTATHEIGHFFNLQHIWGPTNCSAADNCSDDDGVGDTPLQRTCIFNTPGASSCPGVGTVVTDACTATAPGIMWMNFMDYSDDACMYMFTQGQGTRMETALTTAPDRVGLTTSNGCTPPVLQPLDAAVTAITTPANSSSLCGQTNVSPIFTLNNAGSTTLTSATITITLDGVPRPNFNWTGSLASQASTSVTLPNITGLASGPHTLVICATAPNGGTDGDNTNNCQTVNFSVITSTGGATPPVTEGFESATFPPGAWTISIPTGQAASTPANWQRATNAFKSGTASARINWWNISSGRIHFLNSPPVSFGGLGFSNASLSFHYAYKPYDATSPDSLAVQISTDCGTTWTTLWNKGRQGLATTSGFATTEYTPTAAEWTQTPEIVDLTPYLTAGTVYVRFRAKSGFGNNLFLDDINIIGSSAVANDAQVSAITSPDAQFCGNSFTAALTIKNLGTTPLTSVRVNYTVDNNPTVYFQNFTGLNVASNGTTNLTFTTPFTGLTNGTHIIKAYTSLPNGVADQQASNDTLSKSFFASVPVALPVVEGFENTAFNPTPGGWAVINDNPGSITWVRNTAARKTGTASASINIYNYGPGLNDHLDYLRSPLVNFAGNDSAFISFHLAYKQYDAASSDTLEIVYSTNCGSTWTSIWKKGGNDLTTSPGFETGNFVPTAAQWSVNPIRVDLTSLIGSGPIYLALRSKNNYGNNMYIDDINIFGKVLPNYDVAVQAINAPLNAICQPPITPSIVIKNEGKITITSLRVDYTVDGGTPVSNTLTLNLARGASTTVSLANIATLAPGNHTFKVYSYLPNGQADQNVLNDTLTKTFGLIVPAAGPIVESFENNTFPPAGWERTASAGATDPAWRRIASPIITASHQTAAAIIENRLNAANDAVDVLSSPVVSFTAADSVFLKFDVAAATFSYPGSTALPLDTLDVKLSLDCGNSYISVWKKWGWQLQTINQPNLPYTAEFLPTLANNWRSEKVNLTNLLKNGGLAKIAFVMTENRENNVLVDNINLSSKILPAKLKNDGFMIAPNPFRGNLIIQHYLPPTELRGIGVFNSVGQQIMALHYNGNADSYINIDMNRFAAGVYTVKLLYTGKSVSQKVVKL